MSSENLIHEIFGRFLIYALKIARLGRYLGEPVLHTPFPVWRLDMVRRISCVSFIASFVFFVGWTQAKPPAVFQCDGQDLAAAKQRLLAGDKLIADQIKEIRSDADKALKQAPLSVMQKQFVPPSGDKHDYASLSPYWWPDPAKPDGQPYIRKDGEFNPERAKYDLDALDTMSTAVETLGYAYYFTGHEPYAEKAAELLRAWFLNPDTKMNPNVRFAQFVPGIKTLRSSGLIEGTRLRRVVDADGLLAGSKAWNDADSKALKAWFADLLKFYLESDMGVMESKQPNNHGTWFGVQTVTFALYLGDTELAKQQLQRHGRDRIKSQIQPDGSQPYELERTRAFDYSRYNILGHVELAMLGERVGVDLWKYQTDDGRSLRKALDWLLPFALGEKEWQHKQIAPPKMKEAATVLRRAANGMNEPRYEQAIGKLKDGQGLPERAELMFPRKG
jgi:Alginate lyase